MRCPGSVLRSGGYLHGDDPGELRGSGHLAGCGYDLHSESLLPADRVLLLPEWHLRRDSGRELHRDLDDVRRLCSE